MADLGELLSRMRLIWANGSAMQDAEEAAAADAATEAARAVRAGGRAPWSRAISFRVRRPCDSCPCAFSECGARVFDACVSECAAAKVERSLEDAVAAEMAEQVTPPPMCISCIRDMLTTRAQAARAASEDERHDM